MKRFEKFFFIKMLCNSVVVTKFTFKVVHHKLQNFGAMEKLFLKKII